MLEQNLFQNKQLKFYEQKTPLSNQRSSARGCESRSDISALSIDPLVILEPPPPPLLFHFIVPVVEYECVYNPCNTSNTVQHFHDLKTNYT